MANSAKLWLHPRSDPAIDINELKKLEGSYRCDELNATYRLTVRDGRLHVEVGHIELTLSPESKTRFTGSSLVLTTTKAGLQMEVDHPLFAIRNLHLTRLP